MKKYSNLIIVYLSFTILIIILLNKTLVANTIITSLNTWFYTLVPSMAPMMLLSDILINYDFASYIPSKISTVVSKIFNISKEGTLIFFLSLISGFPANGINIKTSYELNKITKEEAEHLLLFNHFANPLFVLGPVGDLYLHNNHLGIIILISHILANILIGIIFRKRNHPSPSNYITAPTKSQNFGNILSSSLRKTISSLFIIAGTVTLFLILSSLIVNIFHLNNILELFVKGIFEMTMALSFLPHINISNIWKVAIATSFLSFGGLSIHLQVFSSLDNKIAYKNYLIGRIYQVILSLLISIGLMLLLYNKI